MTNDEMLIKDCLEKVLGLNLIYVNENCFDPKSKFEIAIKPDCKPPLTPYYIYEEYTVKEFKRIFVYHGETFESFLHRYNGCEIFYYNVSVGRFIYVKGLPKDVIEWEIMRIL
jgi:hypothetical protein